MQRLKDLVNCLGFGEVCFCIAFCFFSLYRLVGFHAAALELLLVGILCFRYYKTTFSLWSKLGIPGPTPWIPFGNFHQMMLKGAHKMDMDNHEKYGQIWGTYTLTSPEINITDPEILKMVLVKDFDHFQNRRFIFPGLRQFFAPQQMNALRGKQNNGLENAGEATLFDQALGVLHDEQWRNVRETLTPTFSPAKLKQMLPYIKFGIDTLIEIVTEKSSKNQPIDLRQQFENLTLDVIASASLGVKIQSQLNPDDAIVACMDEMVAKRPSFLSLLAAFLFPSTMNKLLELTGGSIKKFEAESRLRSIFSQMIASRRSGEPKNPADFLQLMLNTQSSVLSDETGRMEKKPLTDSEMMSQMYVFMGASYDSTPPTLAMTAYYLALHQEMQAKVVHEITKAFGEKNELSYETLQTGMPLLEACLLETLRLWPPFTKFARTAKTDYEVSGLRIPRGCGVVVPAYVIHRMPEYYDHPNDWRPTRMLPEERNSRNPFTFVPFGQGPRNCIGMRFAMVELKMVMAYFVKEFRLGVNEWTPIQINMDDRFGLLKPTHPIYLAVTIRVLTEI